MHPQEMPEVLMPKEQSRQSMLSTSYPISIEFLSIGCIVRVGCKSIPFQSVEDAMKEVNAYVSNPKESQEKWRAILD
jgi:ribosome maturation protein Sdo1